MMPEKLESVKSMYNESFAKIFSSDKNWKSFLQCAANNYKYNFSNQVLIYDQKPDATACASIKTWKDTFMRVINNNTRAIRLYGKEKDTISYVYDVKDTHQLRGTTDVVDQYQLVVSPSDIPTIERKLEEQYKFGGELIDQIKAITHLGVLNAVKKGYIPYDISTINFVEDSILFEVTSKIGLRGKDDNSYDFSFVSNISDENARNIGSVINVMSNKIISTIRQALKS